VSNGRLRSMSSPAVIPSRTRAMASSCRMTRRYEVTREFSTSTATFWRARPSMSRHIHIEDGRLLFQPVRRRGRRSISADRRMPASTLPSTPSTST
jgi:hypothetical protein